jgi:hypothetical protein
VANHSHRSAGRPAPVLAGWQPGASTGNAIEVEQAAPVQVTGNAIGVLGDATSFNDATESATTGGDTTTTGTGRALAGNVVATQGATPVQVDGNAIAGAGRARTQSTTGATATSAGSIGTGGRHGVGSGNVGAVPFAVPVALADQSVSAAGDAEAAGSNDVTARSGGRPGHVRTDGDQALLSGDAAVPGVADPVALTCDATALAGNGDAQCATTNTDDAGGAVGTTGAGSAGSGDIATLPISEPAEVFGNGTALFGNATAGTGATERTTVPGNGFTRGDSSAASGNAFTAPITGSDDVFGNGVSLIGNASGTAGDDARTTAGGHTGTTGRHALAAGDIGQVPVAAPLAAFGNTASAVGTAKGTVPDETRTVRAGGATYTRGGGTASGNVLTAPTALPVQAFGDAAGIAADTSDFTSSGTTAMAGGASTAFGRSGTGSANVVALPTATPVQALGDGGSVVGNGTTNGTNDTTAGSGGPITADGSTGTLAGNVADVPAAGPIQAFGVALASPGNEEADSLSDTYTRAGDDTVTNGDHGAVAGNVVTAQVAEIEQVFATGLGIAGNSTANGFNDTATRSGGDVRTSGEWGALSGDLVDAPATDVTQVAADGAAVLGDQFAFTHTTTSAAAGGTAATRGGIPLVTPLGANATVYRVPVEVLGRAVDSGYHDLSVDDGDESPPVEMPFGGEQRFGPSDAVDGLLAANQVPALADLFGVRPRPIADLGHTQVFPVLSDGLPGVPRLSPAELTQRLPVIPPQPSPAPARRDLPAPRNTPFDPAPGPRSAGSTLFDPARNGPSAPNPRNTPFAPTSDAHMSGNTLFDSAPARHVPSDRRTPAPRELPAPTSREDPPTGELPVFGSLPTGRPAHAERDPSNLTGLPDLPPVPTLPAMPPVSGGPPTAQDVPAGAAAQLMAQLRGLISELESSGGSGHLHPMDGSLESTSVIPVIRDRGQEPRFR